jgi:predicted transcriptional regulator
MSKSKSSLAVRKKFNAKAAGLKSLKALPDDTTFEDMMYELYMLQKIQKGLEDGDAGRVKSHAEIEKKFAKWLM